MSSGSSPFTRATFAPGRVNLIGEHVDYHGLPVLPMALARGVRIDYRPRRDREVVLWNADPAFGERRFNLDAELEPGAPGDWGNYAMAGARTVLREFGAGIGMDARVSSDLPTAAGLSSSSALVVAVAMALLDASGVRVPELGLAEALARGERFVGTAGGGMDQAASLAGRDGHALLISFGPLAVEPVPVPDGWTVAVAHSGVPAEKSGGTQEAYNLRRSGSGEALTALATRMGVPGAGPAELVKGFPPRVLADACRELPAPGGVWALHTVTEAARVVGAVAALRDADLDGFGRLLVESHESLRDVYQVSHPALDRLVDAALEAGAAGARLTGAGFGGCMLAVCQEERLPGVLAALRGNQTAGALPAFQALSGDGARILS